MLSFNKTSAAPTQPHLRPESLVDYLDGIAQVRGFQEQKAAQPSSSCLSLAT
jgi:hypothetical protein